MINLHPSFDFQLFDIPNFSPLQANEFGASTSFSANTPVDYVDFSLNRLNQILATPNDLAFPQFTYPDAFPFFQSQKPTGYYDPTQGKMAGQTREEIQAEVDRNRSIYEKAVEANAKAEAALRVATGQGKQTTGGIRKCDETDGFWNRIFGRCCAGEVVDGKCVLVSDGKGGAVGQSPYPGVNTTGKTLQQFLDALPQGSGIFLIALIALVFLLLFVRK